MKKALIIVDAQKDFMPGGSLAVTDGDQIVPVINKLMPEFDLIIFTQDWHPKDMECFVTQHKDKNVLDSYTDSKGFQCTIWPEHCIAKESGSELHDDIDLNLINGDFYFFKKGLEKNSHPYSGFGAEGLADFLNERNVTNLVITGLATDYCVKDTVIDGIKKGYNVDLIWDGCRGINDDLTSELDMFFDLGVNVTDSETYLDNK